MKLVILFNFFLAVSLFGESIDDLVKAAFLILVENGQEGSSLLIESESGVGQSTTFGLDEEGIVMVLVLRASPLYDDFFDIPSSAKWIEVGDLPDFEAEQHLNLQNQGMSVLDLAKDNGLVVREFKQELRDSGENVYAHRHYAKVLFSGMSGEDVYKFYSRICSEIYDCSFLNGVLIELSITPKKSSQFGNFRELNGGT